MRLDVAMLLGDPCVCSIDPLKPKNKLLESLHETEIINRFSEFYQEIPHNGWKIF